MRFRFEHYSSIELDAAGDAFCRAFRRRPLEFEALQSSAACPLSWFSTTVASNAHVRWCHPQLLAAWRSSPAPALLHIANVTGSVLLAVAQEDPQRRSFHHRPSILDDAAMLARVPSRLKVLAGRHRNPAAFDILAEKVIEMRRAEGDVAPWLWIETAATSHTVAACHALLAAREPSPLRPSSTCRRARSPD